jgi:hypothetical protein
MLSLGGIEGETFSIEERFANGNLARLAADADELAAAKVDVIVAISDKAARAARQATSTIDRLHQREPDRFWPCHQLRAAEGQCDRPFANVAGHSREAARNIETGGAADKASA